jgi:putative ABC transport system ATP-binding protein
MSDKPEPVVDLRGVVEPVVSLRDLTRVHGSGETEVRALIGVSLDVAPGELVAVMGPSGSGKSTLLALAGGLDSPSAGNVVVEGVHLSSLSKRQLARLRRTSIGYVFQDYNLIPALTAAENVSLPLELDGTSARRARPQALAALEEVGLTGLADRFPDEMSGGQRQRTAIARALIGKRRLVLADEPTGALDAETGRLVLDLLVDLARRQQMTVILVTHSDEVARAADRVLVLADGVIAPRVHDPR